MKGAAIARAHHETRIRFLLAAEINHGVGDGRIFLHLISAGPEKQVAGLEVLELKGVIVTTDNRLEFAGFTNPGVLAARIAGDVLDAVLFQNVIDKPGAIQTAVRRVSRAVLII